jgi:hypothetical protein
MRTNRKPQYRESSAPPTAVAVAWHYVHSQGPFTTYACGTTSPGPDFPARLVSDPRHVGSTECHSWFRFTRPAYRYQRQGMPRRELGSVPGRRLFLKKGSVKRITAQIPPFNGFSKLPLSLCFTKASKKH